MIHSQKKYMMKNHKTFDIQFKYVKDKRTENEKTSDAIAKLYGLPQFNKSEFKIKPSFNKKKYFKELNKKRRQASIDKIWDKIKAAD